MHGLLIIDKPGGMTSHDIVRRVRRKLGIRRVGHGGTLDPMATGLIPVAVGDATRLLEFFSDGDKGYSATMRLGVTTDSQDADGEVVATADWSELDVADVEVAIQEMSGPIRQVPPMYSALKRNGVPLYKLARKGVEVERQARDIVIHSIRVTDCSLPDVSFDVVCSKGTYIRTLAHDIGQTLGCGAHLTALRRFQHGPCTLDKAVSLDQLEAADDPSVYLVPLVDMLADLPLVTLQPDAIGRLMDGVPPAVSEVSFSEPLEEGAQVRLTDGHKLLAVACYAPARTSEKRGDFELSRVFTLGQ